MNIAYLKIEKELELNFRQLQIVNAVQGWLMLNSRAEAVREAKELPLELRKTLYRLFFVEFNYHFRNALWEKSVMSSSHLCAFGPEDYTSWIFRSQVLIKADSVYGREKARDALLEGAQITTHPNVCFHVAKLLLELGYFKEAEQSLRCATERNLPSREKITSLCRADPQLNILVHSLFE